MDQSGLGYYARRGSLDPFPTSVATMYIQWLQMTGFCIWHKSILEVLKPRCQKSCFPCRGFRDIHFVFLNFQGPPISCVHVPFLFKVGTVARLALSRTHACTRVRTLTHTHAHIAVGLSPLLLTPLSLTSSNDNICDYVGPVHQPG